MKRLVSLYLVALLVTVSAFAQIIQASDQLVKSVEFSIKAPNYFLIQESQFDLQLRQHSFPVNRTHSIISTDVEVSNSDIIKDLVFDAKVEYINCVDFKAVVIPAECWGGDGKNDPTKWTEVLDKGNNLWSFRYYMEPSNPSHYLAQSNQLRRIMSFFLKTKQSIPLSGQVKITFSNFQVLSAEGKSLTAPTSREIIINLGTLPPTELNLRLSNAQVVRTETINRLTLDLDYSGKAFDSFVGDLVLPTGWPKPEISPATATVSELNGKWRLIFNGKTPAVSSWTKLLGLTFNFQATTSGLTEIKLSNLNVSDSGKALRTNSEIKTSVDLKSPVTNPVKATARLLPEITAEPIINFSREVYRQTGFGDMTAIIRLDNLDNQIKSVRFSIKMPSYFQVESILNAMDGKFANLAMTSSGSDTGWRIYNINIACDLQANLSTDNPKSFLIVKFKFSDLIYGNLDITFSGIDIRNQANNLVSSQQSLQWGINLKPVFTRFIKGDLDKNFGNGKKEVIDAFLLSDYLAGRMPNPTNYQLWSLDYNGDGVISKNDFDDLTRDLGTVSSAEEEVTDLNFSITSFGKVIKSDVDTELELSIHERTGSLIYRAKLSDIQSLPESIANGPYFWRLGNELYGSLLLLR